MSAHNHGTVRANRTTAASTATGRGGRAARRTRTRTARGARTAGRAAGRADRAGHPPHGRTARTPGPPPALLGLLLLAAVTGAALLGAGSLRGTGPGRALADTAEQTLRFLDYMAGVLTLLSLTAAVVLGLAATDRLVLTPRSRVSLQSAHRAAAVASLGFLVIHVAVKVYDQEAAPIAAFVPFAGGSSLAVGLGVIAADLMVLVAVTGAVRGRFAAGHRPWLWRVLHGTAYACWPIALSHGLTAGRSAAVWVLWGYGLCAAAVALALTVRVLAALGRRSAGRRARQSLRGYRPADTPEHATAADEQLLLATHAPLPGTRGRADPLLRPSRPPRPPQEQHQAPEQQPYAPSYGYDAYAYAAYASGDALGDTGARPHPALAETPPHGFAYPVETLTAAYAQPGGQPGGGADWGALTWDTPPHGVPAAVPTAVPAGFPGPAPYAPVEHGGGW
ncbi:hypothetical protein GXW83_07220 [Streptacidiphilus sp. PB12-B1b]|uniref:ferric reductase-like transmembrane domain-containing protein n=1 Tax=Streptacidiphilus sp. PB12-B1b TaxID=2705012 RepID=UPI0015F8DD7D|nr:ferric reductase-like transmembrane domain-containing protein [Streptacidiphilus sp. PB12-B1b]QMU75557.1 hypothetical protein GXW83_07220 [Streptacidiphilus sp. PB12-B1b]